MGASPHRVNAAAVPIDIRESGLLWLINATVFHPRGFALGWDPENREFTLFGDGRERWAYAEDLSKWPEGEAPDDRFLQAEALFAALRAGATLVLEQEDAP